LQKDIIQGGAGMSGEIEAVVATGTLVQQAPTFVKAAIDVAKAHPVAAAAVAVAGVCTLAYIGTRPGVKLSFFGLKTEGPPVSKG
jgi:hypothetical protein